jgi:hypothetical protein
MATSVLRRYTPPTCTLEIAATGSVLSRWTDRTVLKNLRFQLSFDDPKLPPEQQVTVTGNRLQLEALHEAVEAYVQSVLNQAPNQFNALLIQPAAEQKAGGSDAETSKLPSPPSPAATTGIHLKPKGLLSHDLCLGTLAHQNSQQTTEPVVHLTTLQLFDLANALDEYQTEALTLPPLSRPAWLTSPTGWAKIAAVMVLALGATGAVTKFVLDIASPVSQVTADNSELDLSTAQRSAINPSPRLLPSPSNPSSGVKLNPLFPPTPPTGALNPELVPPPTAAGLPPAGVTQAPVPVATPETPIAQGPANPVPDPNQVVVLPSDPGNSAGSPFVTAPSELSDATISPRVSESATAPGARATDSTQNGTGETAPQVAVNRSTAFDSSPQIAEVRNYFTQNWQPPTELAQTLEYRLVLSQDGTIQRIIPLGEAAERFVDRTSMPLMGDPFVSPLQDTERLQVRLVLSPDGRVQTFADGN